MTTRRQFLERSALGFGSAFLLPSLLTSCTDHRIDPDNPIADDGDNIDWNNDAKTVVTFGLGEIPVVGGILSGLVGTFWPTPEDTPWAQVKDQVAALVNQKFDTDTYNKASGKLDDLRANMQDYMDKLATGTLQDRYTYWGIVTELFVNNKSDFTSPLTPEYAVILLPLYAQYANLYLTLLRDALTPTKENVQVLAGSAWGMNYADIIGTLTKLQAFIVEAVKHVNDTYSAGRANIVNKVPEDQIKVEPFKSTNAYDRQMTMLVLDYMDTWQYYDIQKYPFGAIDRDANKIPLFTREIYSDPIGSIVDKSIPPPPGIVLPSPATLFPTQITVWGGQRLDAVQLTYPAGGGPGGVTTTPRMGDKNGGSTNGPSGGQFGMLPHQEVTTVLVTYDYTDSFGGQAINNITFLLGDGNAIEATYQFGGSGGQYASGEIEYTNYALSSIYIHGSSEDHPNTSADCIVFGFMRWTP